MNVLVRLSLLACVALSACTLPDAGRGKSAPAVADAAAPADAARDDERLAARAPLSSGELLAFHRHWCEQTPARRNVRRLALDPAADALEVFLLDYCDRARTQPHQLRTRLRALGGDGTAAGADYLAWLDWHLDALQRLQASADAQRAQVRELGQRIEQLQRIEHELNTRAPRTEP